MRQDVRDHIRKNYGFETRVEPCIECNGDNPNGCPRCGRVGIRTPDGAVYTRTVYSGEQSPTEPRAGERQRFKVGQRVYWSDPDAGLCSGFGEIASIRGDGDPDGLEDQIFTLQMDSGGETETVMSELSEVAPTNPRAQTATPLTNFRVRFLQGSKPVSESDGWCWIEADSELGKVRVFDVPDPDDSQRQIAQQACDALNQHDQLVAALREFVDAYAGNKSAWLGNGQARRSLDRFRELLATGQKGGE